MTINTHCTLNIEGHSYTIARLTDEQGHAIFGPGMKVLCWSSQLVCACLNNSDNGSRSIRDLAGLTSSGLVALITECLAFNGLRKKSERADPFSVCENNLLASEAVTDPRLFTICERPFYLRLLSASERERLRAVALAVVHGSPEKPLLTEHEIELADIFASAAGMTPTELFRSVEIVVTERVFSALIEVSGFPRLPDGRVDLNSGVSSA